jgi:hypothetical protein
MLRNDSGPSAVCGLSIAVRRLDRWSAGVLETGDAFVEEHSEHRELFGIAIRLLGRRGMAVALRGHSPTRRRVPGLRRFPQRLGIRRSYPGSSPFAHRSKLKSHVYFRRRSHGAITSRLSRFWSWTCTMILVAHFASFHPRCGVLKTIFQSRTWALRNLLTPLTLTAFFAAFRRLEKN